MATIKGSAPGRFCWVELGTTDQAAAKAFYSGLFGWNPDDQPMGPGAFYTMLKHDGRDAGALYGLSAEEKSRGGSSWRVYVAVTSADDAAAKAKALGAITIAPPFDVMEAGRMALLQDPTGAVFAVWEAKRNVGMTVIDEPGAFCWGELATRDTPNAAAFYTGLFGWGTKPDPKNQYTEWTQGGQSIGGMLPMGPEWGEAPPRWSVYFQVADCDASAARAQSLGAQVWVPPRDIPGVGRFAVLSDPQGAAFSIFTFTGPPR
jgi:uncharacterized protein